MENRVILTKCGEVEGIEENGVISFKGIRYAAAGRFEYPKVVKYWSGIYDATNYGNCAYQPSAFLNEAEQPKKAFYYHEFREGAQYSYSEDCLFLNIFAPEGVQKAPVLLYIHGGSFTSGCGHEKHFDSPVWTKKGVIGVTINYRLGPLGFACYPELKEEAGHTGNYALYDQLAAIRWIYDNIEEFGGDHENITIMGQSAGAMCVQQLCMSSLANGMIAKAVMCSGGGINKILGSNKLVEQCYSFWREVAETAKVKNFKELRELPVEELFSAWEFANKKRKNGKKAVFPCVDGWLIHKAAVINAKDGKYNDIPYIMCSTSEDIVPPIFHLMARKWAILQAKRNRKPVYLGIFKRHLPGDKKGAWHSSDLWYWFGTFQNCWRPMTDWDRQLSDDMITYLCNFCRNGNPNDEKHPEWKPIKRKQRQAMIFGNDKVEMGKVSIMKLILNMLK